MTFAEFRKQVREIAAEHDRRDGTEPRTTCCEVGVWDRSSTSADLEWGIWDAEKAEHYKADTAERALLIYRVHSANPETAIESVGDPTAETEPAPESEASP